MMRIAKTFLVLILFFCTRMVCAQVTGDITVNGDIDKFYPVVFTDGEGNNVTTELEIGRSDVHRDVSWRGAVIAKFRCHVTLWKNGSNFIDADIQGDNLVVSANSKFIAGCKNRVAHTAFN